MIRNFKLRNEYAREYSLNVPDTAFLHEPEGLGYEMDYGYMRLGYSFVRNYIKDKQMEISGSIIFTAKSPYEAAADFLKFIRGSSRLTLVYTTDAGEYLRDVDLVSYEKTEITEGGVLQCPVVFVTRGLWYANAVVTMSVVIGGDGNYAQYPYKWPASFRSVVGGSVSVQNDGSVDAPFTVTFRGPIVDPSMILMVDGEETARIDITGEAVQGETLNYSSVDGDLYVYHTAADGTKTNLISGLNINNDNFFKLPVGASELKFESGSSITQPITISMRKLFRAV